MIIVSIGGVFWFFSYINSKIIPTQKIKSTISIKLNNDNENASLKDLKKFDYLIEHAIQVKGTLKEVKVHNNEYTVIISSKNNDVNIICKLQEDQKEKIKEFNVGNDIILKGVYKGYLIEMILLNCIII